MTIEGAIVDLQNLIDDEDIPFWAKPSLQKIIETVEAERERYIEERKTGKWIEERTYMECSNCHDIWHYEENQAERFKFCPNCGASMEGAEE